MNIGQVWVFKVLHIVPW